MKIYPLILSILILVSCDSEIKQEQKKEIKEVNVKTMTIKSETLSDIKSYFGTLKFSKATTFVAQQSGVITKLNVIPRQKVKRGELIVAYPPMNHQLQIEQVKIQQDKTLEDYNRQKELYEAGAVTKVSVYDYKTQLEIERKTVQQLQSMNIIKAPFDGIITQVNVNLGQEVGMDMPIFSLAQNGSAEIEFYVTPKEISQIDLNTPAFFMNNNNMIVGKISKKSIQLDESRKSFLVTAVFDNTNLLFGGETVNILVETGKVSESIWIPADTFRKEGERYFVFISNGKEAIKKDIIIGKRHEQLVQVEGGLKTGDHLIVAGIDKLKDGIVIKNISQN